MYFSKRNTNILKFFALFMMLFHHLFLEGRFENYNISYTFFSYSRILNVSSFFKICVSIFAFVSGYGLYLSYNNDENHNRDVKWIWKRYVSTFRGYWIIIIFIWILYICQNDIMTELYFGESFLTGIMYMVFDFFGVSFLFHTPMILQTWWYMTATLIYIILTPILYKCINKIGAFATLILVIFIPREFNFTYPSVGIITFLNAFIFGMAFAYWDIFTKIYHLVSKSFIHYLLICLLSFFSVIMSYKLFGMITYDNLCEIKTGGTATIIVIFVYLASLKISKYFKIFDYFGPHSMNIYLLHNFFRKFFPDYLYRFKDPILIVIVLFCCSLLLSIIIELIKYFFKYNEKIDAFFIAKIIS